MYCKFFCKGQCYLGSKLLVKFVLCSSFSKSWSYRIDQFENFFNVVVLNY